MSNAIDDKIAYFVSNYRRLEVIMKQVHIIYAIALLCLAISPADARKIRTFQPLQIAPLEIPQEQQPELTENYPKINTLEINLFKRTFERENIYKRLTRLENRLFKEAYPNMPLASRVENILANVDAGVMYNIPIKELAKLEIKVLGRTYQNDDTESRITRLEKEMLGAMQGGNLTERYKGFQIRDICYIGDKPENAPIEYDVVQWCRDDYDKEYCWSVGHLVYDPKEPCFDFESIGLRWLEAHPNEDVENWIMAWADYKLMELHSDY